MIIQVILVEAKDIIVVEVKKGIIEITQVVVQIEVQAMRVVVIIEGKRAEIGIIVK